MSTQSLFEERQDEPLPASKKRRIPGACDACKRKKVRCDSARRPNNRCSNCVLLSIECIHTEAGKTLGSARRYVESLEARLEKMDQLFNKLLPGVEINPELEKLDLEAPPNDKPQETLEMRAPPYPTLCKSVQFGLTKSFLSKFYGKTSNNHIIKTVVDTHKGRWFKGPDPDDWLRPHYWSVPKWKGLDADDALNLQPASYYDYPPEELMTSLINLYFTHINPLFPLLHRPIFEQSINQGLHIRDAEFGATVLLVCAHGARYSDDKRVLVDASDSWHSAGWKWYKQVRPLGQQIPVRCCSLYYVQMFALLSSFDDSNLMPEDDWLRTGLGLRLAVDVGAHTKSGRGTTPTAESELWKRAFWCLYISDVRASVALGRCPTLQDEEFDLEEPVDCDDEYWESDFQQPAGKPSRVFYFKEHIRLTVIISQALYLLFSERPSHSSVFLASSRSEQECITEIDTKLNQWLSSLPRHLRLGASRKNDVFELQSNYLHVLFHHSRLVLHRPYIPSPLTSVQSPLSALTICFNAVRSCCSILSDAKKTGKKVLLVTSDIIFAVGLSLIFCCVSASQSNRPSTPGSEEDSLRFLSMLEEVEHRILLAGRFRDILQGLHFAAFGREPYGTTWQQTPLLGLSPNSQDLCSTTNGSSLASSSEALPLPFKIIANRTSSPPSLDNNLGPQFKPDFAMSIDPSMQASLETFGFSSSGIIPPTADILSLWPQDLINNPSLDSWDTFWSLPVNPGANILEEGDSRQVHADTTNF